MFVVLHGPFVLVYFKYFPFAGCSSGVRISQSSSVLSAHSLSGHLVGHCGLTMSTETVNCTDSSKREGTSSFIFTTAYL